MELTPSMDAPKAIGRFQRRSEDKLRGGYYTPREIASWLCQWAIRSKSDAVLEPSSGDGIFLASIAARLLELGATPKQASKQIRGIEVEQDESRKASLALKGVLGIPPNGSVACGDFFGWLKANPVEKYDCAVGNPPFIRYQNFPEPSRSLAMAMMSEVGLRPNKLTNTWVPFLVGAVANLKERGRLAFVLPAELLQVSYAAQLRQYLANHFQRLHIFACNHLVFDGAEQETLLLLADGYSHATQQECLIEMIETHSLDELLAARPNHKKRREYSVLDHGKEKWLKYFLNQREIGFMRSLRANDSIVNLGHHAEVDVGVVTGCNNFFVVEKEAIQTFNLDAYVVPLVGRSSQLAGAIINRKEWQEFADDGQEVHLLVVTDAELKAGVKRYIKTGEDKGVHLGYKCSIREQWYAVPSVWAPDCFLFRQIYDFPRTVLNQAQAVSTDTVHRMRCRNRRNPAVVLENTYTHLAAASAEIEGRSYGGGVLELEPTEAERLLMPKALQPGLPATEIDRMVRAGKIEDVLKDNDRYVLRKIGLSIADCAMLREIWKKMRDRRRARKRRIN